MTKNDWYDCFIETIYKKYPKKSQLTDALTDLLGIEKESVYRRLRKDILFTTPELVQIASSWNISLDELVGFKSKEVCFKVQMLNYIDPTNKELEDLRMLVKTLHHVSHCPDAEYMEVFNQFSRTNTCNFPYFDRFYLLKWMYQYNDKDVLPFSRIYYPEEIAKLRAEYYTGSRNIANTILIWDQMIFHHIVNDILYFHSICLITDEEKEYLKKDLYSFLDYLKEVLSEGYWPETGKRVSLYISHISIDANYSYYYSEEIKVCRINAFTKNEFYAYDPEMVEHFRNWMQLKKRSSIQVSVADERSRIEFFNEQYKLIDKL